jgi:uncharacterized membrane protein (DUF106 family)
MRKVITGLTLLVLLGVFAGSALAQSPNPGPEQERMAQMMKMMEQMQGQMKQMHEQMMGQMQGQMKQMREQMMGQMSSMMHQHGAEMKKACHGAAAQAEPK